MSCEHLRVPAKEGRERLAESMDYQLMRIERALDVKRREIEAKELEMMTLRFMQRPHR